MKEEILALLTKKTSDRQKKKEEVQRVRLAIDLDHSEGGRSSGYDSDHAKEVDHSCIRGSKMCWMDSRNIRSHGSSHVAQL